MPSPHHRLRSMNGCCELCHLAWSANRSHGWVNPDNVFAWLLCLKWSVEDWRAKEQKKASRWLVAQDWPPSSPPPHLSHPPILPVSIPPWMSLCVFCVSVLYLCHLFFPLPFKVWSCFPSQIPTNSILFPTTSTILSCAFGQWHWRSERISVLRAAGVSLRLTTLLYTQLEDTVSIPDMRSCTIIKYSFLILNNPAITALFLLKAWGTILVIS